MTLNRWLEEYILTSWGYAAAVPFHKPVCGSHGERIAWHNQLRDAIYQVAASSNLAPRKEENALLPGTSARPADVLIPHWSGGRDTALDVTVVSLLLTDRVDNSVTTPGHTLTVAFNEKCSMLGRRYLLHTTPSGNAGRMARQGSRAVEKASQGPGQELREGGR